VFIFYALLALEDMPKVINLGSDNQFLFKKVLAFAIFAPITFCFSVLPELRMM
jgi:hypothetical protein